ncbi:MAG: ACT domain-containing protein [bacterium]|nr:ACT domain-containing protein [bacterium]
MNLTLKILSSTFAVCQLPRESDIPSWATKGALSSITKTNNELSVVCEQELIPEGVKADKDWRALMVQGPLDFSLVGILANLSSILASAGVSIFAISTYDTDYLLVKEESLEKAIEALSASGHTVLQ